MEVMVELHAPTSTCVKVSVAQASTPGVRGRDVSSSTKQMSLFRPELRNSAPERERLVRSRPKARRNNWLSNCNRQASLGLSTAGAGNSELSAALFGT
jgi:hypothetical protein